MVVDSEVDVTSMSLCSLWQAAQGNLWLLKVDPCLIARHLRTLGGTDEIQRENIAAALGLYTHPPLCSLDNIPPCRILAG
jgi:hypothetical protein